MWAAHAAFSSSRSSRPLVPAGVPGTGRSGSVVVVPGNRGKASTGPGRWSVLAVSGTATTASSWGCPVTDSAASSSPRPCSGVIAESPSPR